jgi:ribosomal protein S18 acetylase RimI-like enzyme
VRHFEVKAFSDETEGDVIGLVNATTAGWPYSRPLDTELIAYWKTLGTRFQPEHMLIAYADGKPAAFAHGEREEKRHNIRFLAMAPGALESGMRLLEIAEEKARAAGCESMRGPCFQGWRFYGGYVIGLECYHPHWYVDGTNAFLRSRYEVTQQEVMMVANPRAPAAPGRTPKGYVVGEVPFRNEFGAVTWCLAAIQKGQQAAMCGARFYPKLTSPLGGPIGQIGGVGTKPEHRNKGLATHLVALCCERLVKMGAGELLISTGLDNYPALRSYEKVGFRRMNLVMEWTKRLTAPAANP